MEIWKDIIGYEGLYQISSYGRVMSTVYDKPRIMKQSTDGRGYPVIRLVKNSKKWTGSVHRLVAVAFIDNPENKSTVNHINEIKSDNNVTNLEWLTNTENINYGNRNKLVSDKLKKSVTCTTLNDVVLFKVDSIQECVKLGFNHTCVSLCCNNKRKSHMGLKFKFTNNMGY